MSGSAARKRRMGILAAVLLLAAGSATDAHQAAQGVVRERMEEMKAMARSMKAIGAMTRGAAPFDAAAATAAAALARRAGGIVALFPEGSLGGVSEAGRAIWRDPDGFRAEADALIAAAHALETSLRAGDRPGADRAFRTVARSCSACHRDYRVAR